jgi:integrase
LRPRTKDRHLPPCVYLKHSRYWYVKAGRWTDLGTDLGGALLEYARLVETPKGSMPDFLGRAFKHHCATHTLAPNTLAQYRIALDCDKPGSKGLKQLFAQFAPAQVRAKHVMAMMEKQAATPNMVNRRLSLLRTLFDYAVLWDEAQANPCAAVDRLTEGRRKRYITDEEFRAIYAKAGPRLQVIMDLQYLTGQRISDVLGLKRKQLTEAGILLTPQKTKHSTGVQMMLKWTPELKAVVERAKTLNGNVQALTLLRGRTGKAPDYKTVYEQFQKAAEAAGVADARLNDQRAKSATDAKRQGKDARALLGHASDAMTERYLRQREVDEVEGPIMKARDGKTA